ncbi:MAG: hydantoinase B/oxoprolinase family protein [Armatimonadetes bacterium]|nr:hydantoinase B/oxoprolinase family protein [Armatimonadota bacterium]
MPETVSPAVPEIAIDPTRLEVFRNYLAGVAEETWSAIKRCAYSLNIKERGDCSAAVFDQHGEMIALPNAGVPLHQGSMEGLVEEIVRRYPEETIQPGDIFITNDPYSGGATHTPDYCCVAPLFGDHGRIVAYVANVGHHADVGGRVACSQAADNESIFEEGVLIPPVRLCHAGEMIPEVFEIICHNSREPQDRRGDVAAHIASIRAGLRRLGQILESMGTERFLAYSAALLDYSERRMRSLLAALPDGRWEAEDYLDGDGVGSGPLRFGLVMIKEGGTLTLDWSDVPPQMKSSRNIPLKALRATCFAVIRSLLDPGMHLNGGVNRVVTYVAPPGSAVNPVHPAAVAERATPCQVLADITATCIGQMIPERAIAAMGAFQGWAFTGIDPRTGKTYANYESIAGGLGATTFSDGIDAVRGWPAGSMNPPIEAFEQDLPVIVRRYELRQDSGGAGRFRGGLGMRRDLEIRGHETRVVAYAMRQVVAPPGVHGGMPAPKARFVLNPGTPKEKALPVVFTNLPVDCGDVISCETPGGGGLGDPRQRPRELVERDLASGLIASESARRDYGYDPAATPTTQVSTAKESLR